MSHFAQRIWKEILGDLPQDRRPFHCNSCDYTNNSSVQLIVHVGVVHKMAIKYHFEVLNVQNKDWSQVEPFGQRAKPMQNSSNIR